MTSALHFDLTIPETLAGMRLDQGLAHLLPDHSRATIQRWIQQQEVTLNGKPVRAKDKLKGNEHILIQTHKTPDPDWLAEAIQLDIVAEDESFLVINKPPGMVVHPAAGHPSQTLLNAILHHAPGCRELPRAGIIHRLDRDTSGLLVIAKTAAGLRSLSQQMRSRTIHRHYQAVVTGTLISGGTVDQPIGRHPIQRKRMAVTPEGRPSVTHYRILERFRHYTRLSVQLETGRTHQIRVHLAHIGYPLLGDPVYGGRLQLPKNPTPRLTTLLRSFRRQALHAAKLGFKHPLTGEPVEFEAPLPEDMQHLVQTLRMDDLDQRKND